VIAVVCAAFDARADAAVADVRASLRALGGHAPRDPAHRPHLTLAAARVDHAGVVVEIAGRIAMRHKPIRLTLARVEMFPHGRAAWLGPSPSAELAALQRDTHLAMTGAGLPAAFGERSDPDRWVAHCTLSSRVDRSVVIALRRLYQPIDVTVDALATLVVGGRGDVGYTRLA
jgi:2'-5' RNA ligase